MTFGAGAWRGDHVAAMMTGKAARQAMLHHPGGTIGALKTITAMPAKRERRITPPIEEQERLFALFQTLIYCPDQLRSYERRVGKECVSKFRFRWSPFN